MSIGLRDRLLPCSFEELPPPSYRRAPPSPIAELNETEGRPLCAQEEECDLSSRCNPTFLRVARRVCSDHPRPSMLTQVASQG